MYYLVDVRVSKYPRSYRAIELLFSPTVYDACATDLWSFAVTLSSFFTNLRWVRASTYDDESENGDDDSDHDEDEFSTGAMRWSRRTLFKASRGEIAQIWSIFQLLGTPTETNWPVSYRHLQLASDMLTLT